MSIHIDNESKISGEELLGAQYFHGHKCPAMPQGLRAGHLAMDILGVQRARTGGELSAILEIGDHHFSACFADGIQYATGCTFGKGNITKNDLGKFAVTLIDPKSKRATRVAAKYERMKMCLDMPFFELRKQGVPPFKLDPSAVEPLIDDVINHDWREMFDAQVFENYPVQKSSESFNATRCDDCGEMVVAEYAKTLAGHTLCGTCFTSRVHRKG